jgi:hypothetical protein
MLGEFKRYTHERACGPFGAEVCAWWFLPCEFIECGLGVKKIALEGSAIHEEMNDVLGLRCEMGK